MRVALAALMASGCLYVGDVNRVPSASLIVIDLPQTLIKGAPIQFQAKLADPEDGFNLRAIWSVDLADVQPSFIPDARCDYRMTPLVARSPGQPELEVVFNRVGNWVVSVHTLDRFNAPSQTSTVMVQVVDSPPTFTPPSPDLLAKEAKDPLCNTYVAGQPLSLYFDGTVTDLDASLEPAAGACPKGRYDEKLTYRWEILGLPATSHAVLGPKPSKDATHKGDADCPLLQPTGSSAKWTAGDQDFPLATCVYPDVGGADVPDMYQVALFVSDGTTEIRTNVFDAPVRADLPPCLTGAAPQPGAYVVDRSDVQRFTITGATDDLDKFPSDGLSFQWSIWREADPVWRTVPDWTLSTYELDTSAFGVGEKLRVRVQPADRGGIRGGCDPDLSSCVVDSCLLAPGLQCQAWMTWDLELR